jgi:hypothetical protein
MKSFNLEIDELAAVVGFLNAKKLVGMDEKLFAAFSEENVPNLMAKLQQHGWMSPAERPDTWHINTDLMQTLAVAVAPDFAILARSNAKQKSIVFYLAKEEIVEIVVTDDRAVVANIPGMDELVSEVMKFLDRSWPAEIVVARVKVKGEGFDAGHKVIVDSRGTMSAKTPGLLPRSENDWNEQNVAAFVRGAIAELGVGVRSKTEG